MIRIGLAIAVLGLTLSATPLQAQEDVFAITHPVDLDPADPEAVEIGELIYRGGVEIEPGDANIGGISGLEWYENRLYAVTDDGRWLTIEPDEIDGRLIDALGVTIGNLNDERGRRLRGKDAGDAEAITRDPEGGWLVSFEQEHRVWRYAELTGPAEPYPLEIARFASSDAPNNGIETLAMAGTERLYCGEFSRGDTINCNHTSVDQDVSEDVSLAAPAGGANPVPTDAACDGTGTCYILMRSYTPGVGNHIAILRHTILEEPEIVAQFAPPLTLDNFEGLALREQFGKTYLYLVSDNNFSSDQRTLLMKFEVKADAPPVVETPEAVTEYDTVDVVLETAFGDITIRLETERAPITAANFLRYADEDRFDGTVFYRAMNLDREPRPNGLLQGGTQFDPKRILPGIPHEPTTVTGLSHTNGAVSMAMGDPGTANGDFSIMLGDQTGLDARPDAAEAVWQNGYAVFGYVIDGMDVVAAIHAAPVDPDKGEGWMKGQMLADPVVIVDARRAEVPAE